MDDLHDLLQHYEECHVRLEDDENSLFDNDDNSWSPSLSFSSLDSVPSSPTYTMFEENTDNMDSLKRRAAAYLSDLYNATSSGSSSSSSSMCGTPPSTVTEDDLSVEDTGSKKSSKKRFYNQYNPTPSALDLLTQSAAKKLALASGDLPTPMMSDEDFLAQAGALLASANSSMYKHFNYIVLFKLY